MIIRCKYDELIPLADLKKMVNPDNTNKHPKEQIERLAKIMKYQGVRKPIYLSKQSKKIQAGHGRLLSALKNGWKEFPVEWQEYDNKEQELADLTSDNAIASWADLDMSMVTEQLESLSADFNHDLLGIQFLGAWNSDISDIEKIKSNTDGIAAKITIVCDKQEKESLITQIAKLFESKNIKNIKIY